MPAETDHIKEPFRGWPDGRWRDRRRIIDALFRIGFLAEEARCDLDWLNLAPESSEEAAEQPLQKLHAAVTALFTPPEQTSNTKPQTPKP